MRILFIFLVFAPIGLAALASDRTGRHEPLFHIEAGTGQTVIFVHGAQEDYRVFLPQIEALADDFRVISYSRQFNYPNAADHADLADFSVAGEASDLARLIDHTQSAPAVVVGHSYGGLIALEFAHRYPEKIRKLILSEPPMLRLSGCEKWLSHTREALIDRSREAFATGDSGQVMTVLFEFFVGADIQDRVPPPVLESLHANLREIEALVHAKEPFPDIGTNVDIPVMLITAGNTMPMLECTNQRLLEAFPNATHLHLEQTDHNLWVTHTEPLANAVHDFASTSD